MVVVEVVGVVVLIVGRGVVLVLGVDLGVGLCFGVGLGVGLCFGLSLRTFGVAALLEE